MFLFLIVLISCWAVAASLILIAASLVAEDTNAGVAVGSVVLSVYDASSGCNSGFFLKVYS